MPQTETPKRRKTIDASLKANPEAVDPREPEQLERHFRGPRAIVRKVGRSRPVAQAPQRPAGKDNGDTVVNKAQAVALYKEAGLTEAQFNADLAAGIFAERRNGNAFEIEEAAVRTGARFRQANAAEEGGDAE